MTMDQGAYPGVPFAAAIFSGLVQMLLPGPYRVQGYAFDITAVSTNKCVYVAYRGPWEMETWVRERMLDEVAHELGHGSRRAASPQHDARAIPMTA